MGNYLNPNLLSLPFRGELGSLQITQDFLWNIFTVFFIFYALMSLVFVYHWNRYEGYGRLVIIGEVVYFAGSLALLVIAGMSVAAY